MNYITDPIFKNYFNFSGRATRKEFGIFFAFSFVVMSAFQFTTYPIDIAFGLVWLLVLIPMVSITVRRIHDLRRSGWWALMLLIPFLNLALLIGLLIRKSVPHTMTDIPAADTMPANTASDSYTDTE